MDGRGRRPQGADEIYQTGPLSGGVGKWRSAEGLEIEMFSREESVDLGESLDLWSKMPGWFAIGQDGDDGLLCIDSKTGRCALVAIDDLSPKAAQELAPSCEALLAMGDWDR